jgi:hypothetical protein
MVVKRFTRSKKCDTAGCVRAASYLEKHGPGRNVRRVQLCWPCAVKLGKVR